MKKFLLSTLVLALTAFGVFAQVTTSSLTGTVKDSKETLIGATIKATHQPSGTTYSVSTNADGRFTIPAMRVGGPYKIEVSYVGYQTAVFDNIYLKLGEPYILSAEMGASSRQLDAVTITGTKSINAGKTGASTNINSRMITTLPTITRSINDFTRLTPQTNGSGSFAGRDNRYNNIQVDGASLNNTFGTSTETLPGGGQQPISIEAYDEISVKIAPVDVRQTGFTGAGIYAITKSGTNTFHGSVYGYYKDQSYNGTNIGNNDISASVAKSKTNIKGFTLGGPIIKNKLFFFGNYEREKQESPGIPFSPNGGSGTGTIAAATTADLQKVSDYLKSKFGYETGGYDNFPSFKPQNKKYLARIDWNISDKHKMTVKYSKLDGSSDVQINATSTPNNGPYTFTSSAGTPTTRATGGLPNARYSQQSLAFENSNYGFLQDVTTGSFELNSSFNSKMSNQLLVSYKKYDNPRTTKGSTFPTVDIFNAGNNYITAGSDPFTKNNEVIDNTTNLTDNFTYYTSKHTLTGGLAYEFQKVGNAFMPGAAGSYIYNSLNDFLTDAAPVQFTYNYSLIPGEDKVFSADLKVGQISIYGQDEFNVNKNLKLTYGLRADKPIYLQDPVENPQISALQLPDANGVLKSYTTGKWPTTRFIYSPRIGFRLNALDNKSLVLRGSTGIFTGRIPYVFLTNMPSNTGMYNFGGIATAAQLATIKLNADPSTYAGLFPQTAGLALQPGTVVIDPNFKFPQLFRSDLAVEKNLGNGFNLTVEGLYSKDINATKMRNANLKSPTGTLTEGTNSRVRYVGTGTANAVQSADRNIYSNLTSAIVLENTSKGYSANLTAELSKSFKSGFYGSVAYSYTNAKEVTANPGSTAASVWGSNPNVGTANDVEVGYSQYYTPHRVVANASYTLSYLKHGSSTFSVYYNGSRLGDPISYIVNGDINGDGNAAADLMYIPKTASELTFAAYSATFNGVVYTYSPQAQAAALEQFISNTPYLKAHRGEYAARNAAFKPWYNRVDVNFLQDIFIQRGAVKHTLEFSAVVQNFANMLDKYWGVQKNVTTSSPLTYVSIDANGVPTYNLRQINGKLVNTPFQDATANTTWSLLLGLKYKF